MLGGIVLILVTGLVSFFLIDAIKRRYDFVDQRFLARLFFYHLTLAFVYYLYALYNPSDSRYYFRKVVTDFRGDTWGSFYGTSTPFIEFVGYPFIRFLGFSYEATMVLFAFFGFVGFVYFYIVFKENIHFRHKFIGVDLLKLFFLLPNLHFWSSSFGKGSVIFLGVGLFFYGISRIRTRFIAVVIGGLIVYHVRPHIMLVILVSSALGFVFSTKGISFWWRAVFLIGSALALSFIYEDVLTMVGIDEDEVVVQGFDLSHRARELSKATSGIDITNYSLPAQVLTFLYRPLFFDAPGALGIIVSIENLFYIVITLRLLGSVRGISHVFTAGFLAKSALLSFIAVSVALAQISGNLGLAIRQKSQVMMLFLFFVISFLDAEKMRQWKAAMRKSTKLGTRKPLPK